MSKDEKEKIVSPPASTVYVWLNEPDTKFDKEGKYKVTCVYDPEDNKHNEFLTMLWQKGVELSGEGSRIPIKKQDDGSVHVEFASKFQPKLFDAKLERIHPDDVTIGTGTVMSVSAVINPYDTPQAGKGITLWIQGAQILELQEFQGAGGKEHGFHSADGYETSQPTEADPNAENTGPDVPLDGYIAEESTVSKDEVPF